MAAADWLVPGVGVLGDLAAGSMQARATREAARMQLQGIREGIAARKAAGDEAKGFYDPYMQLDENGNSAPLKALQDAQASVAWTEFNKDEKGNPIQDFSVQAYLDPSMQYQQDQARKQLEASAAAGGPGLRSGAFAKGLQTQAEQFAQTDWGNAFNRMGADRQFSFNDYVNKYNQQRQQVQDELSRTKDLLAVGQWGAANKGNAVTGTAQDIAPMYAQAGAVQGYGAASGPLAAAAGAQALTDPTLWTSMLSGGKAKTAEEEEAQKPAAGYGTPSTQRTWMGGQGGSGGTPVSGNLGPITG